jgi:uncharacterized pyridoxamine 5'-phosphate oxidase family protein
MKNNFFLVLILITALFASCNRAESMRNKINFNDNFTNVQDSLLKIIPLLKKIQEPVNINKGYDYRGDNLFVNNKPINSASLDTIPTLSKLSENEKKDFLKIAYYLRSNEITSGSYDNYLGLWLFEYRYLPEGANTTLAISEGYNLAKSTVFLPLGLATRTSTGALSALSKTGALLAKAAPWVAAGSIGINIAVNKQVTAGDVYQSIVTVASLAPGWGLIVGGGALLLEGGSYLLTGKSVSDNINSHLNGGVIYSWK